ncbi:hypothetical protein ARTSIC4J27_505 [Pseudarthrobacter siccitolerans]|uniref:Uncharacterized protein n=1 Tax=Pseudarthrobacter siccitolerans TaxID=861266 RepID=A0A024GXV0_9MICC|nr:hypothetical protein ARTSIC4J27_505 [Pseudarthrobacter siccitolerans]
MSAKWCWAGKHLRLPAGNAIRGGALKAGPAVRELGRSGLPGGAGGTPGQSAFIYLLALTGNGTSVSIVSQVTRV